MAKRLMILAGMLAILLAASVPAFAQQQLTATGVLEKLGPAPSGEPGPRYAITDEASGTSYELFSVRLNLEPFVGQRVTIDGEPAAAPPSQPGFSNLLGVTRVEPAQGGGTTGGGTTSGGTTGGGTTGGGITAPVGTITVTGVVMSAPGDGGPPVYFVNDEASGKRYFLLKDGVSADFSAYEGKRVTVEGTPQTDPSGGFTGNLNVTSIGLAQGGTTGGDTTGGGTTGGSTTGGGTTAGGTTTPSPDRTATLSFELTVKGEPPAGTTFLGFIPAEGGISAPLTDPDGDGVFTGSVDVPKFPPGPVTPDEEPVSLPVQIAQNKGGSLQVIKDFGQVKIDGDKTFSAKINFKENGGGTTAPEGTTPETTAPAPGTDGSSDNNGGSASGGSENSVSAGGSSGADNSGSGSSSNGGSGSGGSGGGSLSNAVSGVKGLLPSTGGMTLGVLGIGALLIGGGLLIRKISR